MRVPCGPHGVKVDAVDLRQSIRGTTLARRAVQTDELAIVVEPLVLLAERVHQKHRVRRSEAQLRTRTFWTLSVAVATG